MRRSIAAIAALAALTFASAANAAVIVRTYILDTTEVAQFTGSNFGTVTVTDNGIDLHIAVALASGYEFRTAPDKNHHDLTFDLKKNGVQDNGHTVLNLSPTIFFQDAGNAFKAAPFNGFNYAVDCVSARGSAAGCTPGWNPTKNPTTMNLKIAGIHINEIASVPYTPSNSTHSKNIFFAVDVVNSHGYTGSIGASSYSQISYAPEPTTWALMTLGFGLIGAGLRRRSVAAV